MPVAQIGGSVGRCYEFDGDFMPTRASVQERWKRIDRDFHRGEVLPPVSLYKVGGFYFVLDGHHCVSVACYHGVKWIRSLCDGVRRRRVAEQPEGTRRPSKKPPKEEKRGCKR